MKQATQAEYDKILAEVVTLRAKVLRMQDDLKEAAAENMRLANRVSELNRITRDAEIMVPRNFGMTFYGRKDLGYE